VAESDWERARLPCALLQVGSHWSSVNIVLVEVLATALTGIRLYSLSLAARHSASSEVAPTVGNEVAELPFKKSGKSNRCAILKIGSDDLPTNQ
jgi:hypothetical protein